MAVSCISKRTNFLNKEENADLKSLYTRTIIRIKTYQQTDGTFGNVYTTALLTQALISAGEEKAEDWNLTATVKYLIKELNETSVDFLTVCTALPVLNRKSLADIATIDCSANPRSYEDEDIETDWKDNKDVKISVQYTLYVGDQKDLIHTIALKVPVNTTAYKVMQLAGTQDPKYQFKMKIISRKMYIYEIGNILNDPEEGKFWGLHLKLKDGGDTFASNTNPDKIIMNDEEELIMWYKTVQI